MPAWFNNEMAYGAVRRKRPAESRSRNLGVKVVFGLRNLGYLNPGAFEDVECGS